MGNDLEIEIRAGSTPGTYEVEVDSPAGPATGTMQLDADAILNRRRELAASVLASAVTQRSAYSTLEAPGPRGRTRPVRGPVRRPRLRPLHREPAGGRAQGRTAAGRAAAARRRARRHPVGDAVRPRGGGVPLPARARRPLRRLGATLRPAGRDRTAADPRPGGGAEGPGGPGHHRGTPPARRRARRAAGAGARRDGLGRGRQLERPAAAADGGALARAARDRARRRPRQGRCAGARGREDRQRVDGGRGPVRPAAARVPAGAAARRAQLLLVG